MHLDMMAVHRIFSQGTLDQLKRRWFQFTFTRKKQIDFLRDLTDLLPGVGAPLPILAHIEKYSEGGRRVLAKGMRIQLARGGSIADEMPGWFHPLLVEAARIGEKQGVLVKTLTTVLEEFEDQADGMAKAFVSFIYPVVLSFFATVMLFGLDSKFYPIVLSQVGGDPGRLPGSLYDIWSITQYIKNFWFHSVSAVVIFVVGLSLFLNRYNGSYRDRIDNLPGFRTYADLKGAGFMQMYSILKSVNVAEHHVIQLALEPAGPYYAKHLRLMSRRLATTSNIGDVINTGLISQQQIERFKLLAGSANYVDALHQSAKKVYQLSQRNLQLFCRIASALWMMGVAYIILTAILAIMSVDQLYTNNAPL